MGYFYLIPYTDNLIYVILLWKILIYAFNNLLEN